MNKIAATIKSDFNAVTRVEKITQIYVTQDLKRGFYIVHDHQETSELKGQRLGHAVTGGGELFDILERTVVLTPKGDFETNLEKSVQNLNKAMEDENPI